MSVGKKCMLAGMATWFLLRFSDYLLSLTDETLIATITITSVIASAAQHISDQIRDAK